MCITYGKTADLCYAGVGNGSIYCFCDQQLVKKIAAHEGPIFSIFALDDHEGFVTGGKDGIVMLWDEKLSDKPIKKYIIEKNALSKQCKGILFQNNPSIKAICVAYAHKKIIIGTKNAEIIEIDKDGTIDILTQVAFYA